MSMKNKVFLVMLLSIAALSAGCNTVAGAGTDIQRGGEKIEGAATTSAARSAATPAHGRA
jgi:predicted small secreted protein